MITCLENDLAEVQIDVVDGTDGTDVEGISKTGILLCESHADVRLLAVHIAGEHRLCKGAIVVRLLPTHGLGILLTGNEELTFTILICRSLSECFLLNTDDLHTGHLPE